jgi:hypothetical protein
MRKLFLLAAGFCALLYAGCGESPKSQFSHAGLDSVLQKQVLLANDATFEGEPLMARGSAFMMRYQDQLFGVTGRPWIVGDTSMHPTPTIKRMRSAIKSWRMYPHGAAATPDNAMEVAYDSSQSSSYKEDIIFLKAQSDLTEFAALKPQFELPTIDDTLFLIGCSIGDPACKQNVYPVVFQKYVPKGSSLTFLMPSDANTDGFGGAPIVNRQGEVVAMLISGGDFLDLHIIDAIHIKAVQKVLQ